MCPIGDTIGFPKEDAVAIEKTCPELERIVSTDQELEVLGSGFGAAEGPLWHREGGYLLFSEVHNDRTMKWSPQDGITVFREPTDHANGLDWDPQHKLIACEDGTRRMTRLEADGSITVVANRYKGNRLNRPNDVVVRSDGSIYFTDPGAPDLDMDLDFSAVFRVSPDLSTITLLVSDFVLPNGLAFSPDESILYIDDSMGVLARRDDMFHSIGHIRGFDVQADGTLANSRVFCELRGERSGIPDGMKVDMEGNVYCTGPGGVWVIDPSGKHLGTILTGADQTTNCAWGGEDWKTLFITTLEPLARIQLKIPGVPVPH